MGKTKKRVRKSRKTRQRKYHKKSYKGGGNDFLQNTEYPSQSKGMPALSNWKLPDPKYIDHVTVDR